MRDFTKIKVTILKSLGTNFPVLKEWGYEPSKLILVVVEPGELKRAICILSEADMPTLNSMMNQKQLVNAFISCNLSFAVYPYVPNRKNLSFISTLSTIARLGEANGKSIRAFPIVVTEGLPNGIDLEDYFTVYLSGSLESILISADEVVPSDKQLPVVWDKMRMLMSSGKTSEEKSLLAATCFLYPNLVQEKMEDLFDEYISVVKTMVNQDDENKDSNNIKDIFIREIYCWQENTDFAEVYELPCLEMSVVAHIERVILFDTNYFYLKEHFFKEISKNLLNIFSVDVLKKELLEAGVLSTDKSKTYTVKVTYMDLSGQYQRERMLRFDRRKMEILGEMELIEQCIARKEKVNA